MHGFCILRPDTLCWRTQRYWEKVLKTFSTEQQWQTLDSSSLHLRSPSQPSSTVQHVLAWRLKRRFLLQHSEILTLEMAWCYFFIYIYIFRYLTECMGLKEDKETLSKLYESMRRKYIPPFFTVNMSLDKRFLKQH